MEKTSEFLIYLMACSLQGTKPEEALLANIDMEALLRLAKAHSVSALVVALFLLLLLRGMSIAVRARDKFGALLTVGFVVQVILQAILNIAVVTNTIPNTGISLPFFSSGGTSLLMLLGEMGIVLSVSRQTDMV